MTAQQRALQADQLGDDDGSQSPPRVGQVRDVPQPEHVDRPGQVGPTRPVDGQHRAGVLAGGQLHEQVDGEWSFIETLRHLGFAHACWVGGVVLAQRSPWHPLDLPWDEAPEFEDVPWARRVRPELHEVMALRRQRRNTVAEVLDGLTDAGLERSVTSATQFLSDATGLTVADCLRVVLNAGAWTHYSLALWDACAQLTAPLVEVHISDPKQRAEEFRHTSVIEPHAVATIAGQGIDGYRQALEVLAGV